MTKKRISTTKKTISTLNNKKAFDASTNSLPAANQTPNTPTVRQGAHLSEHLTISDKKAQAIMNTHGDSLRNILKDIREEKGGKFISEKINIEDIGIKLEPASHKLLNAITVLLHDKSENKNTESELYYMGNHTAELVPFGGKQSKAPSLMVTEQELIKAYSGNDNYSGKEQTNLQNILKKTAGKLFAITIVQKVTDKKGKETEISITDYLPLYRLKHVDEYEGKRRYLLQLNPIFVEQITSKWVELPRDINVRFNTVTSHGNKTTEACYLLVNYLSSLRLKENWNKKANAYITQINESNLFNKLGFSLKVLKKNPKRCKEGLHDACKTSIAMGICKSYEIVKGAEGQNKYIFFLPKEHIPIEDLTELA